MYKIKEPVQATKFRQNFREYVIESKNEPVLVNSSRLWNRVFLDLEKYNKLVEIYEDYQDSQELINLEKNDSWEYFSLNDV